MNNVLQVCTRRNDGQVSRHVNPLITHTRGTKNETILIGIDTNKLNFQLRGTNKLNNESPFLSGLVDKILSDIQTFRGKLSGIDPDYLLSYILVVI